MKRQIKTSFVVLLIFLGLAIGTGCNQIQVKHVSDFEAEIDAFWD